jgi:hypothetical protein
MSVDPFKPMLRDGRLYGRGAVDDKGCLAAFMLALRLGRDQDGGRRHSEHHLRRPRRPRHRRRLCAEWSAPR